MATDGHEIAIPLITDPAAAGVSARSKAASYFALTKPRIIELLLITTVPSMVLAAGRWPGVVAGPRHTDRGIPFRRRGQRSQQLRRPGHRPDHEEDPFEAACPA